MGTPGRPPKVRFPITRTYAIYGTDHVVTVKEGRHVSCLRCTGRFALNSFTAYRHKDPDDMPIVRCPYCGYRADIFYYYPQCAEERKHRNVPEI